MVSEEGSRFGYKGWVAEIKLDAESHRPRWTVRVELTYDDKSSVRSVPLSFKDGRTFSAREEAIAAGESMARVWIDRQG